MGALVLAANPIFLNTQFSFMTDVPALFFFGAYLWWMLTANKKGETAGEASLAPTVAAGLFLCAAVLIRQTYAVFALANVFIFLRTGGASPASTGTRLLSLASLVVAPILTALCAENLMQHSNEFGAVYTWYKSQFSGFALSCVRNPVHGGLLISAQIYELFCYLGLFCVPLLSLSLPSFVNELKLRSGSAWFSLSTAALILLPGTIYVLAMQKLLMPFSQNLMRVPMIGPVNLMGLCVPDAGHRAKVWLTVAATVAAFMLLACVLQAIVGLVRAKTYRSNVIVSVALAAIGLVVFQTCVLSYDRYYLMALPAVVLVLCGFRRGEACLAPTACRIVAGLSLAALAAYSTCATQDYMSWNRARWQSINELRTAGIAAMNIDGGPEFDYTVNPALVKACVLEQGAYIITHRGEEPWANWRWWPINGDEYTIAFNTVPGYDVVKQREYFGALTMSHRKIYTLCRNGAKP